MHSSMKFTIISIILIHIFKSNYCECRYLPTRNNGDNLDKLRELIYQILESSSEQQDPIDMINYNRVSSSLPASSSSSSSTSSYSPTTGSHSLQWLNNNNNNNSNNNRGGFTELDSLIKDRYSTFPQQQQRYYYDQQQQQKLKYLLKHHPQQFINNLDQFI